MCRTAGYIGPNDTIDIVLKGLKCLEYRGYDSAGVAGLKDGELHAWKEVGKVAELEKAVIASNCPLDMAIAHTRWATHGKPTRANAHPHFDSNNTLAVVHNGIIENHAKLRSDLEAKGAKFTSDTDTEVVAKLIASFYHGNFLEAVQKTIPLLKGTYALAIIHKDHPGMIIGVAHESPLIIGIGEGEVFLSSDSNAFATHTRKVVYLSNAEIAVVQIDRLEIYDQSRTLIAKDIQSLVESSFEISKGDYDHFTLKEIFEQPSTLRYAMLGRCLEEYGTAFFEELQLDVSELQGIERILILACGTSWHAGCVASYLFEDKARIPVQVEISSEYRYKNPIVPRNALVIAISQSGETADTVAAVRELKAKGAKVVAICNVQGSTLTREADSTLYLRAGPEIGVCSTKAFTSQVTVLSLFALLMARMRHMDKFEGLKFLHALKELPDIVQKVLESAPKIEAIAKKYSRFENFFYIGRLYMYPTALEGALKLKEISYVNANGYPAGEMKHGPIALINDHCPTVALCANSLTFDKILSNVMEIKARSGAVIAIAEEGAPQIKKIADDLIEIPKTIDELASIPATIATQLFAYYVAFEKGADIDKPRNLAKSVTVE